MIGNLVGINVLGFTPAWLTEQCAYLRANPALMTNANLDLWLAARGTSLLLICENLPPGTDRRVRGLVQWFKRNPAKLTAFGLLVMLEPMYIRFGGPADPAKNDNSVGIGDWWPRPFKVVATYFPIKYTSQILPWYCIYWWERIQRVVPLKDLASLKPDFTTFRDYYSLIRRIKGISENMIPPMWSPLVRLGWKYGIPPKWYGEDGAFHSINSMEEWIARGWDPINCCDMQYVFALPLDTPHGTSTVGWNVLPLITISK